MVFRYKHTKAEYSSLFNNLAPHLLLLCFFALPRSASTPNPPPLADHFIKHPISKRFQHIYVTTFTTTKRKKVYANFQTHACYCMLRNPFQTPRLKQAEKRNVGENPPRPDRLQMLFQLNKQDGLIPVRNF